MNEYVGVIHLDRASEAVCRGGRGEFAATVAVAASACCDLVAGISETIFDAAGGALMVRFDREKSTVADIVRCLEDHGLSITGIAQSRADAGAYAAPV